MSAAPSAHVLDADFDEIGEQRRSDRRSSDRRALRFKLDTRFAATLVNQIAPPEAKRVHGYAEAPRGPRAGIAINVIA
jgi:hypothetical protein